MTDDSWQRYARSLSALGALAADFADQQLVLEDSVAQAQDEVGIQLEAASARLESMQSDAVEARRRINRHLAATGLTKVDIAASLSDSAEAEACAFAGPRVSGSDGASSAESDLADADPGRLLSRLHDLGRQIEAQGATLAGILRAQRRADARAAEDDARRVELAERARARQARMDEARREATRRRQDEAERARATEPALARKPEQVQKAPGGRSMIAIIWIVSLLVVIAVVLVVVLL